MSFIELLRQLTPDVQLSVTKLHKEVLVLVHERVILDGDGKQALLDQFQSIVEEIGLISVTSKFQWTNYHQFILMSNLFLCNRRACDS